MRYINVKVDRETYQKLRTGQMRYDIRVDSPLHNPGDIIIYTLIDENGQTVETENMFFRISGKGKVEDFAERIGEQLANKRAGDSDDLIVINLEPISV